jgi:starch synthase (maltosyl-transferring)
MSHKRDTILIATPEIELGFSLQDGGLRLLQRPGEPSVLGYAEARPSIDVRLGDGPWLAEYAFVRYLHHTFQEHADHYELVIVIGFGPLMVRDIYSITGSLIRRSVAIKNVGDDPVRLRGVRLNWPALRIGLLESCRFEAPSSSVRSRISLETATEQRLGVLPRRFFAPGLRDNRAIEPAPLYTPGLMVIHNPEIDQSLLCWYDSQQEPGLAQIQGHDTAVTLQHEVRIAGWLARETQLSVESQYLMLVEEPWYETLLAFRDTLELQHNHRLAPHQWLADAALYETHPALFGGFTAMREQLPDLVLLGINTVCLMPIWPFGAGHEPHWDGNWRTGGDLYALRDITMLDPTLGQPADLQALIADAHGHGLRVVIDLPLLGGAPASPLLYDHPTWFCRDEQGQLITIPNRVDIIAFDWANAELQSRFLALAKSLMADYQIDGIRVITPRATLANWAGEQPRHASQGQMGYLPMLSELRSWMTQEYPRTVLIGDLAGPAGLGLQDASIDELVHHMFVHTALGRLTPLELSDWLSDHCTLLPAGTLRIAFTESHRTRLINPLADGMRGSRISRLILAAMVLSGFVPSIWVGQEHDERSTIMRLLSMRRAYDVIRCGTTSYSAVPCSSTRVFTVLRQCGGQHAIGLFNFSSHHEAVTICLPVDTLALPEGEYRLHELINGQDWQEQQRSHWQHHELLALNLTLEPFGSYCFIAQPS